MKPQQMQDETGKLLTTANTEPVVGQIVSQCGDYYRIAEYRDNSWWGWPLGNDPSKDTTWSFPKRLQHPLLLYKC